MPKYQIIKKVKRGEEIEGFPKKKAIVLGTLDGVSYGQAKKELSQPWVREKLLKLKLSGKPYLKRILHPRERRIAHAVTSLSKEERQKKKEILRKSQVIYVITDGEFVKIGISKSPENRLRDLQVSHPKNLRLMSTIDPEYCSALAIERVLHEFLRHCRTNGEWFKPRSLTKVPDYLSNLVNDIEREAVGLWGHEDLSDRRLKKGHIGHLVGLISKSNKRPSP